MSWPPDFNSPGPCTCGSSRPGSGPAHQPRSSRVQQRVTGPGRALVPSPAVAVDNTSEQTAPSGGTGETGPGGAESKGQPRGTPAPSRALWSAEAGAPASCCPPTTCSHFPSLSFPREPSRGQCHPRSLDPPHPQPRPPDSAPPPCRSLLLFVAELSKGALWVRSFLSPPRAHWLPAPEHHDAVTPKTPATPAPHSLPARPSSQAPPSRQLPGPGLLSATLVSLSFRSLTSHLRPLMPHPGPLPTALPTHPLCSHPPKPGCCLISDLSRSLGPPSPLLCPPGPLPPRRSPGPWQGPAACPCPPPICSQTPRP